MSTSAAVERFYYATVGRYKVRGVGRGVAKLSIGLLGDCVTPVSARWLIDRCWIDDRRELTRGTRKVAAAEGARRFAREELHRVLEAG